MRGVAPAAAAGGSIRRAAFSTYSGGPFGFGGAGGGRGRGASPPATPIGAPAPPSFVDEPPLFPSSVPLGRGRGRGGDAPSVPPPFPSSPLLPSFAFLAGGRGRGGPSPDFTDAKKPMFFIKDDIDSAVPAPEAPPRQQPLFQFLKPEDPLANPGDAPLRGAGRGKQMLQPPLPEMDSVEVNRHARHRPQLPKLSQEEAVKRAIEILSRAGPGDVRGRGNVQGEMGLGRGRGRGRGRGMIGFAEDRWDERMYLGDNADGERLAKRLGEERMKVFEDAVEEACLDVLPSPIDDVYLDAVHAKNLIDYEPEWLVNFNNPDIEEREQVPLKEVFDEVKPYMMAYEGMQSQEEWEKSVENVMDRLPAMEKLVTMYSGPDRVTAKQQEHELSKVASELPDNIPSSVKNFTDRTLLSLKNNPGWRFDKKCKFMDKFVRQVQKHYKE